MILSEFKRKNVKKRMEKEHKNSILNRQSSDAKVKSVLILVDESIDERMSQIISNELSLIHSNIHVLTFKDKVEKELLAENCITEKDFGLFGNFKNDTVKKSLYSKIDLLINYTVDNQYLNSLVVLSNALFKVGFLDKNILIYDLMIDIDKNDYNVFNGEVKKYLKILNKI